MTSTLPSAPFSVIVHLYESSLRNACAYELVTSTPSSLPESNAALVFIGGLGDGPHTVPYIRTVASALAKAGTEQVDIKVLRYSVFEVRLSSSFAGYGFASLAKDVMEIDALVRYLRQIGKRKIVLMGHSTGCQVSHRHSCSPSRDSILQLTAGRTAWNMQITRSMALLP
jgi:hypothetical protein